jgi:hypothetical protein
MRYIILGACDVWSSLPLLSDSALIIKVYSAQPQPCYWWKLQHKENMTFHIFLRTELHKMSLPSINMFMSLTPQTFVRPPCWFCWCCTRELSKYLWRRRPGRQVMICACVTPPMPELMTLVYGTKIFLTRLCCFLLLCCSQFRFLFVCFVITDLLTILYLPVLSSITSKVYVKLGQARRFSVC